MLLFVRHLLSFVALPFVVCVVAPFRWIRPGAAWELAPAAGAALTALGAALLLVGLALFVSSLFQFVTRGRGTLAPWDPPRNLVVSGPYRFVRNPMISGVLFTLFAEACLRGSRRLLVWAFTFLAINLVYIPLFEEPGLARRFGEPYEEYRRHVRRFLPRATAWTQDRP